MGKRLSKYFLNAIRLSYKSNHENFDFPDYDELSKTFFKKLSLEHVDAIQHVFNEKCKYSFLKYKQRIVERCKEIT